MQINKIEMIVVVIAPLEAGNRSTHSKRYKIKHSNMLLPCICTSCNSNVFVFKCIQMYVCMIQLAITFAGKNT